MSDESNLSQDPRLPSLSANPTTFPQTPQPLTAVTPPTNQTPEPITNNQNPNHSKKLLLILFALLILFVLILAGGLALSYRNYSPIKPPKAVQKAFDQIVLTTPLPKTPRIIMESTLDKWQTLKSANLKTEASVSSDSTNTPFSSVKLKIEGPVNFEDESQKSTEADIALEVEFEGASFNASGSIKTTPNTIYFKINELPFGDFYQRLADFKDRWFYYQFEKPKEDNVNIAAVNQILLDFAKRSKDWSKITSGQPDTYILETLPPKSEMDKLIFDLLKEAYPQTQNKLINSIRQENIATHTEKIQNLKITTYIDKKTRYIKKSEISLETTVENFALPSPQDALLPLKPTTLKINLSTELSDYNKPVVIIPPSDAQNIKTFYQQLLESLQTMFYYQTPDDGQKLQPQPQEPSSDDTLNQLLSPSQGVLGDKSSYLLKILSMLFLNQTH